MGKIAELIETDLSKSQDFTEYWCEERRVCQNKR